jgi:hypothetical protein
MSFEVLLKSQAIALVLQLVMDSYLNLLLFIVET